MLMPVDLRDAETSDITNIADIWHAQWHAGHAAVVPKELTAMRTHSSFLDRAEQHLARTRITEADGKLAGFHMIKGDELFQFYVSQQAQGRGVASVLMKDAEAKLLEAGIARPFLACAIGNDRAAGFYRKTGWQSVGRHVEELETADGPFHLEVWRFEKQILP